MNLSTSLRYSGRIFTAEELETTRRIIAEDSGRSLAQISRLVCKEIGWYKPDGGLKDMRLRVVMLRMRENGLLTLPPPKPTKRKLIRQITTASDPYPSITERVDCLENLHLKPVESAKHSALWNEYIQRYHYLGYSPLPGAQIRYIAFSREIPLAAVGFGAAAWKTTARDDFIGWSKEERQKSSILLSITHVTCTIFAGG